MQKIAGGVESSGSDLDALFPAERGRSERQDLSAGLADLVRLPHIGQKFVCVWVTQSLNRDRLCLRSLLKRELFFTHLELDRHLTSRAYDITTGL